LEKEKNKELIIAPPSTIPNLELFLDELKEINTLFIEPTKIKRKKILK